ncbi:MAG: citramalate synthase [Candidatus Ancaeobacter aquaticus]|nr:citramalate synthase [Candidatus Ancaeobacter aquaticus]
MKKTFIYDTTLRDGTQAEGVSFSVADKVRIAERLDGFGIDYVEGGWPGSNPKDIEFFDLMKKIKLKHAKMSAFGSTRRANTPVEKETNILKLLEAETPVVAIFGKSWILHVTDVLKVSKAENLRMIQDSVGYLHSKGKEVIFDAEHFFDGYKDDPEYALETLKVASEHGASTLALCDTNGGTMPNEITDIVKKVHANFDTPIGIHVHNDGGMANANSILAVLSGAVHVQGTINGYGERCGNANLCTIVPSLVLKLGYKCVSEKKLKELVEVSRFVDELANLRPNDKHPYVGLSAFAHKGGMHVNAVEKNPKTFEHIVPELVGNKRRILISELSGKSNVLLKTSELGLSFAKDFHVTKDIIENLKKLEHEGYEFEAASGSFELLVKKALKHHKTFFKLEGFRVIVEKREDDKLISEATIKVKVGKETVHTAAEGEGPVNALDNALRKALCQFYPEISKVKLADFKVRVLDAKAGTAAKVRVLIESSDDKEIWGTVGVSENIIEASWQALVDSVEYKLLKTKK